MGRLLGRRRGGGALATVWHASHQQSPQRREEANLLHLYLFTPLLLVPLPLFFGNIHCAHAAVVCEVPLLPRRVHLPLRLDFSLAKSSDATCLLRRRFLLGAHALANARILTLSCCPCRSTLVALALSCCRCRFLLGAHALANALALSCRRCRSTLALALSCRRCRSTLDSTLALTLSCRRRSSKLALALALSGWVVGGGWWRAESKQVEASQSRPQTFRNSLSPSRFCFVIFAL